MIRFRIKLFGFLLMPFISHNGNAQSVNGYVDDHSALVHFQLRDSVINEIECMMQQQELKLAELGEELEHLLPKQSCFGSRPIYNHRDSMVIEKKTQEIETYELESNRQLEEKVRELNQLVLSSLQSELEVFCQKHTGQTILFKSALNDCAECLDYTTDFVLFLEKRNHK